MIAFENVQKTYRRGAESVAALSDFSLALREGELLVLRGPSGCGKTTFLLTAGGMLRPSAGVVRLGDQSLYALPSARRARLRADHIGFVFQMFHLIPYLSVLENVLAGGGRGLPAARRDEALALIERVGLGHRRRHRPGELSAGEAQRAAIARAMMGRPRLILADEPTGNLDPDNAARIMEILSDYARDGATVAVVTHGTDADRFAHRIAHLRDGRLERIEEQ